MIERLESGISKKVNDRLKKYQSITKAEVILNFKFSRNPLMFGYYKIPIKDMPYGLVVHFWHRQLIFNQCIIQGASILKEVHQFVDIMQSLHFDIFKMVKIIFMNFLFK